MTQDEAMIEARKLKQGDLFWCLIDRNKKCLCRFQRLTPGYSNNHMDIQVIKCITGNWNPGNTTRYQYEFDSLYIPPKNLDSVKKAINDQRKELAILRKRELELRELIAVSESALLLE